MFELNVRCEIIDVRIFGCKSINKNKAEGIDINDHINTSLYKEALDYAQSTYGEEYPDFFEAQQEFFASNNTGTAKE